MKAALPREWRIVKLESIAASIPNAIVDGPFGSNLKLSDYIDNGVPVLQGKNITNDSFHWFDIRFISHRKAEELKRSSVRVGDILIVKIGSIGYSAILDDLKDFDYAIIPANLVKVTPNLDKVDLSYLHKWLTSTFAKRYLMRVASKTAQPALSLAKIKTLAVPLPPIIEQRRIAMILDRAETLRAKRRAAIGQLEVLTRSIFLDLFGDPIINPRGWPTCTIGELLESASYGTSERSVATGELPVLRMNNITRTGEIDLTDLKFMPPDATPDDRYLVRAGDVLFNRTNSADLVGKTAVYHESKPMAYAGYLIRLRVTKENDSEFLGAFLNSAYAKRMLRGMCKSIIGMANINATEIQAMKILHPPLTLQREFARRLAAIEKLKRAQRASLAEMDALFASLQYRAFRGEL